MNSCSFKLMGIKKEIGVITLNDQISAENCIVVREFLNQCASDERMTCLVLDVEVLNYLNSTGTGVIIVAYKHCRELKKNFVLLHPSKEVKALFKQIAMNRHIALFDSVRELYEFLTKEKGYQIIEESLHLFERKSA